jgi:hypothetical protein
VSLAPMLPFPTIYGSASARCSAEHKADALFALLAFSGLVGKENLEPAGLGLLLCGVRTV